MWLRFRTDDRKSSQKLDAGLQKMRRTVSAEIPLIRNSIRNLRHIMTNAGAADGGSGECGRCDDSVLTDLPASGFCGAESGVAYATGQLHFYCVSFTYVP